MKPPLAILMGGGSLPLLLAEAAQAAGRDILAVAMEGIADAEAARFPHRWVAPFDIKATMAHLREAGCRDAVVAGSVSLPDFSDGDFLERLPESLLKIFWQMEASDISDDRMLSSLLRYFESEGLEILAVESVCPDLRAVAGNLTKARPSSSDEADMDYALRVAGAIGSLNVGQAAVSRGGAIVAVEAMEGTDAMLKRAASLIGFREGAPRRGVLVKLPRPHQDMRVDLPAIGPETASRVSEAGLSGIALREGGALLIHRREILRLADEAGLFVTVLSV